MSDLKTAVVAIGGNALLRAGEKPTIENQIKNVRETAKYLAQMVKMGYDIVITHGNGPQVGNLLLQNEISKDTVPPMPMDVCVAESQGQIGYLLQQMLTNQLQLIGIEREVAPIITRVLVSEDDPAFGNPTKPIGPYYSKEEAERLMKEMGWKMKYDGARGGYRRVVPSPEPIDIVEKKSIKRMVFGGDEQSTIVIASGGGGIPVVNQGDRLFGIDAVIDKDLAGCVLATSIGEEFFTILTDVPNVYINFRKEGEKALESVTLEEIKRYQAEGHFAAGSMGPKIKAAIRFLENGGEKVLITSPDNLINALNGNGGTYIGR